MILICDSGSTKASWAILGKDVLQEFDTKGLNPLIHDRNQITEVITDEVIPKLTSAHTIDRVEFFGAGCNTMGISILEPILNVLFKCSVLCDSDLVGSAIATLGMNEGIVAILGTGSNSGYFKNGELIFKVPALGYILGDEGSGAYLGKHLLSDFFKHQIPKDLSDQLALDYNLMESKVIEAVYKIPNANKYLASFAPFLSKHINETYCLNLVRESFSEFFNRNICNYKTESPVPLCFTGSIATYFSPILKEVASDFGFNIETIEQYPIKGLIKHFKNL